ncbi:EamA family transporter [Paenibacillus aquistagni]|uniref:EamA-like transporter family protein n=1 Tax=Paenibacillus aquistagni TaxID=1852522 RepID=A0A1X7L0D8_9BACL|nr:EamA-like transporter family protein [Paenibacillus aquistagni]
MIIALVLILVITNSVAQVFLKLGAVQNKPTLLIIINIYTIIGYSLFFLATLLSVYLLKFISFKELTVIIALNYVFTFLLSILLLKERFTGRKVLSNLLIVSGVIVFNL